MINITKPTSFDPKHYFNHYINCAPKQYLSEALLDTEEALLSYIDSLSEDAGSYAYEKNKWTIKQVLQHINDTERIMSYRAFRISRKDKLDLLGFDENEFAENDYSSALSIEDIRRDFIAIRKSTEMLFSNMHEDVIDIDGLASHSKISPRAIGWVIAGHAQHHLNVLGERYTPKLLKL